MNIPALPTDSLYKFGFVGGIALVFLSFYIYSLKVDKYTELSNALDIKQIVLLEKQRALTNRIDFYNKLYESGEMTAKLDSTITEEFKIIEEQAAKHKIEQTIIESEVSHFDQSSAEFRYFIQLVYWLAIFGAITAVSCGLLWYFRLQKFHDIMLVLQYESMKRTDNKHPK